MLQQKIPKAVQLLAAQTNSTLTVEGKIGTFSDRKAQENFTSGSAVLLKKSGF